MKFYALLIIYVLLSILSFGQQKKSVEKFKSKVIDSKTSKGVKCDVYKISSKSEEFFLCTTNDDGTFNCDDCKQDERLQAKPTSENRSTYYESDIVSWNVVKRTGIRIRQSGYALNGQYKAFYHASSGLVHSHGAAITGIATAGGGVVLKAMAKPKNLDSALLFSGITFKEINALSTIYLQTRTSSIVYADTAWLMRDAAMLVKSEEDTMYRDINLLGELKPGEKLPIGINEFSKYYIIEIADSLRRTKSGQTLLYMDIMLSSKNNIRYYSCNAQAINRYLTSSDSLVNLMEAYNDSIRAYNDSVNTIYRISMDSLYSLRADGKLDSTTYRKQLMKLIDNSKNKLEYKRSWNDYTYNDENTNYTFYCNQSDKRLIIDGVPNYTFLSHDWRGSSEVDSLHTSYFAQHLEIIKNLNYTVVDNAERFGKIAAFYRYLKVNYPKLWTQVYTHYSHVRKTRGETPRFIETDPPNDN